MQAQNLMILQRKDEAVSEILATATYVVIYVFEPMGKQWERKEVGARLVMGNVNRLNDLVEGSMLTSFKPRGSTTRLILTDRGLPLHREALLRGALPPGGAQPHQPHGPRAGASVRLSSIVTKLALPLFPTSSSQRGNQSTCT